MLALDSESVPRSPEFAGLPMTTEQAQNLVRNILENPVRVVFGDKNYDVYNAAGQGLRFEIQDNKFVTFLQQGKARR